MQVIRDCQTVGGILELTSRHFELPLHLLMAVADGRRALSRVLVSLGLGDLRTARGRRFRGLLRVPLRSNRIHLRGRCRIGSRNPRCKGRSRWGILR